VGEKCTWENCNEVATYPQVGKDKEIWANLCQAHHAKLDSELLDVKKVLSNWIKASGGAKVMARKMAADVTPKISKLIEAFNKKKRGN
jgi:hypothetical protein